jgi:hypothetical protein
MLKQGQKINFIQDNLPPIKSPNTKLICAWMTCGGKLIDGQQFRYTVEKTDSGEDKLNVTWLMDAGVKVEFDSYKPVPGSPGMYTKEKETISFSEFQNRIKDEVWCEENAEHPISYIHFYKENLRKMISFLKKTSPAIKIRTAKGVAVISQDTPEDIKQRILSEL